MSQQVRVERELVFGGIAAIQGNISGPPIPQLKIFDETFVADADEHDWTESTQGTTIAHSAVDGGATTITAGGSDKDCGELSHTAQWSAANACGMLAKVKISQITTIGVAIGFVDVRMNTNDRIAMEMTGAALTDNTTVTDFCGLIFDTDATSAYWYCGWSNAGTEATPVVATSTQLGSSTLAPTADTYFYVAVQTDTSGNVIFYYGSAINQLHAVGRAYSSDGAIAYASTDLLTPYVGFIARSTDASVCTVSRIITWQNN